ncbi:MAG: hypothetical protein GAK45_01064 [Pseudomonas citronellolis]|nr:MAG: hypothetical protein GAK45_01064 [Pseudomonas citronellolis]
MSPHANPEKPVQHPQPQPDNAWVGGSIIDAGGREVPITEGMVQHACRELERQPKAQPR